MGTKNQEPGFFGSNDLISLGGIRARYGRGRQSETTQIAYNTPYVNVLPANVQRISAIIKNNMATGTTFYLCFGEAQIGTDYFPLDPGQSLQIDQNFPWTGMVNGTGTGAGFLYITEVSVP